MAGLHIGSLKKFSCSSCSRTPDLKKVFGCTKKAVRPAFEEIEEGKIYQYWNCILHFVPYNILEFFGMLRYIERFRIDMPSYQRISRRFLNALSYYESKKREYANG